MQMDSTRGLRRFWSGRRIDASQCEHQSGTHVRFISKRWGTFRGPTRLQGRPDVVIMSVGRARGPIFVQYRTSDCRARESVREREREREERKRERERESMSFARVLHACTLDRSVTLSFKLMPHTNSGGQTSERCTRSSMPNSAVGANAALSRRVNTCSHGDDSPRR